MARIHVFRGQDLVPLDDQPFASEKDYQELLADHPELMPGEMIDPEDPPRFALIIREAGIALADGDGGNRWSLDHLFVDHNGVPTLVEVKRAQDTRERRLVVAQMLDYAANLRSWQPGKGRDVFEQRCAGDAADPVEVLDMAFGSAIDDYDAFWSTFDRNVTGGNLRLIFVADNIPSELTNIIEFLDSQFKVADVMAVEIRQLTGSLDDDSPNERAFISTVKGKTATATAAKPGVTKPRLQHSEFDAMVQERAPESKKLFDDLMAWCESRGGFISFGTGTTYPACYLNFKNTHHKDIWAFQPAVGPNGAYMAIRFDGLSRRHPFDNDQLRGELRDRLNKIDGVSVEGDGHPSFPLSVLAAPDRYAEFLVVANWFADQVTAPAT